MLKSHPQKKFVVRAEWIARAPAQALFALVKDSSTYPQWSAVGAYRMERPGHEELHGVGEIRVLITGPISPREEIVEVVENRYVAYRLLSGLPMSDYLGETELQPLPDGRTRVIWQSSFNEPVPLTGWFWWLVMSWVLRSFVRSVSKAAEQSVTRAA